MFFEKYYFINIPVMLGGAARAIKNINVLACIGSI
jgi:hypothetical protein